MCGKPAPIYAILILTGKKYPNLDFDYFRYPYDKLYHAYFAKLDDILAKVETPFALFADDDDFFIKKGVLNSAEFLLENPDFVCCGGKWGSLKVTHRKSEPNFDGNRNAFFFNFKSGESIDQRTAKERVRYHFSSYFPTFYDVHRIEALRMCYKTLLELDLKDLFLMEFLTSFLAVASGKVKKLPVLYLSDSPIQRLHRA